MKKLIASAIVAAAIALPAAPATAETAAAWWGRKPCGWSEIGTIVWHDTPATDYQEIDLCIPRPDPGPGASDASAGPIVGVRQCPAPYTGVIVYHVDYNTGGPIDLVALCIPVGE